MMRKYMIGLLGATSIAAAFNNKAAWKLDADGKVELRDGNPVLVGADGAERVVNVDTIPSLQNEAQGYRSRATAAEQALEAFKGLDAATAREAIAKMADIDQSKLIDSGKLEEVKAEIKRAYEAQISEAQQALSAAQNDIVTMRRQNAFNSSKFVANNLAVPADMIQAVFGGNFKDENGSLVPYDANGNKIYSTERVGEIAGFDEALKILVNSRPDKDNLLRAEPKGGSGNEGRGGQPGTGRTITRNDFEKLAPHEQRAFAQEMREGKAQIASGN